MPRNQWKNTINSRLNNMSPLEPGNPITSGFEKCNTAEAQNKDLKVRFVSMIKVLKGKISKSCKKIL